ncbi:MAG: Murein DD-endopeptidase MepH precursor [Betaproteobacteria bacterium ADurb.Bin341]|nr:MAG: Murein DD-endopeptidase MepH precursor [Betaproteobacteria bacterium ADurb.Bin341]
MKSRFLVLALVALVLAGCASSWQRSEGPPSSEEGLASRAAAREVVLFALSLVDTGYRFGGKNPQAGLDCSGMVSYVFDQAAGVKMQGSAAEMARRGRPVGRSELRPGDLVFFNTANRSYSHVGIYLGGARFVHAPSSNGRVRIDRLDSTYYAKRFEAARSYFD